MGFIFFRLGTTQAGIQDRLGVLFFICVNQTFGTVMPTISVFPEQRQIIKRERAAGTYRTSSAYLAKFMSTLPLTYAGALLLAVPVYWMIGMLLRSSLLILSGLQNNIIKYFTFICIVLVHSHTANSLGLMVGSFVPSAKVGQIIAPLFIVGM